MSSAERPIGSLCSFYDLLSNFDTAEIFILLLIYGLVNGKPLARVRDLSKLPLVVMSTVVARSRCHMPGIGKYVPVI